MIIELISSKTKIQGEIVFVLFEEHIKELKNRNEWPYHSIDATSDLILTTPEETFEINSDSDSNFILYPNTNRMCLYENESRFHSV